MSKAIGPHLFLVCLLLGLTSSVGCTTTHSARTIGKGNLGLEATLGGPITTNLGGPVPIPNLFAGARYGLREDLDLSAAINLTGPVIPGIGLDLQTAVHWFPIQPEDLESTSPGQRFAFGGSAGLDWLTDFQSGFTVLPYLELTAGYRTRRINPFVGTALVADFYRPMEQADYLMVSPYLGLELMFGDHFGLTIRGTLYDVTHNAYGSQVAWIYLVDDIEGERRYAPLGVSFGFSWDGLGQRRPGGKNR